MRTINFAAVAAATAIGTLLVAACGPVSRLASLPAAAPTPVPTTTASTSPVTASPQADAAEPTRLPISVESDRQMQANGNNGPSSVILLPTSCSLNGTTVTAEGTYTNGGFVPDLFNRYGDIIVLYVRTAPSAGEPEGIPLGVSDASQSPAVGSAAPWRVSLSITPSVGTPAQCVVAAQPTHDVQLAPATPPSPAPAPTTSASGGQLPISVESNRQMQANGNDGPSSAILRPTSCTLTGTTVTAEGGYTNGGFVPNVYNRYGDIIVLYVRTAPFAGEPEGSPLGVSDVSESPAVGSAAPWHVSLPITLPAGAPAQCVVAAQPTHDIQLAP
jgi:hypothetical protein